MTRDTSSRVRACERGVSVSVALPKSPPTRPTRLDSTLFTPDPYPFAALVVALCLVAMPSFSLPQFDGRRVRSYLFRLPLCTRALLVVIVAFWIASLRLSWFQQWAALIPSEMNLGTSIYCPSISRCCLSDHSCSVPTQHLPSTTCWLHTHDCQHIRPDSAARTFRGRAWLSADSAPLHRPFVLLIPTNWPSI